MKYDAEVARAVAAWGPRYGVTIDPALVHAVIERESGHGRALVTAEPGGHFSFGPMMVLDSTATSMLGVSDPTTLKDPAAGIWQGVRYLASLLRWAGGDVKRAISAYNTGKGRAIPNPKTGLYPNNPYVVAVLGFWNRFKRGAGAAVPVALPLLALVGVMLVVRARRRAA